MKSLDWRVRKAKRIGRVPSEVLDETVGKILALVDSEAEARSRPHEPDGSFATLRRRRLWPALDKVVADAYRRII